MKLKILLLLIVASAICIVEGEPSKRLSSNGGSGNPLGIIKAELVEEDASAVGGDLMEMASNIDQEIGASSQRIVIKPVKRRRGKRIRIRLVNKPKNYVRLKVSGTKNVEQKYPGDEDGNEENGQDYDGSTDEEGNETKNSEYPEEDSTTTTTNAEDTQNVKKVPEPYEVEKIVHVPVEKIVHVPVEKIIHVPVEKIVEKIVTVPKPYPVEKIVHVPKIVEKYVYSPLFGKTDGKSNSYSGTKSFSDLTNDSKLKFGASGSSLDIIYPNGHTSTFPSNAGNNGLFNSYGQPLGKHPKFPDFEDINNRPNKFHSILDNDAFDFGGLHTSKPKDHYSNNHHHQQSHGKKNNKKNSNKNRNNKNKNHKNKGPLNNHINHHQNSNSNNNDDDYYSSSSSANSHSYSGISMPSYTHEFTVSNSDQKEVFFNPTQSNGGNANYQHGGNHPHQVHYESLPFKYPPAAVHHSDAEYVGHATTQNDYASQYNWAPSSSDFGSSTSAFNLPTQYTQSSSQLSEAESAQIGPVFRPPRKNPPTPFHGKKKGHFTHDAPRAGPRRPVRHNQGETYKRGPAPQKMAGHQQYRPEGGFRAAASNVKGYVHQSRPRPMMAALATEQQIETVMMPPLEKENRGGES